MSAPRTDDNHRKKTPAHSLTAPFSYMGTKKKGRPFGQPLGGQVGNPMIIQESRLGIGHKQQPLRPRSRLLKSHLSRSYL